MCQWWQPKGFACQWMAGETTRSKAQLKLYSVCYCCVVSKHITKVIKGNSSSTTQYLRLWPRAVWHKETRRENWSSDDSFPGSSRLCPYRLCCAAGMRLMCDSTLSSVYSDLIMNSMFQMLSCHHSHIFKFIHIYIFKHFAAIHY